MHPLVTGVVALALTAAVCAVIWLLIRPVRPEKRWHIFFTSLRLNGRSFPLYMVGDDIGTRSFPDVPVSKDTDWVCVTVTGYPTREAAHLAANEHGQQHHAEVVEIHKTDPNPSAYRPTGRNIDPDLER